MSVVESCVLPQHLVERQVMHRRLSHTAWKSLFPLMAKWCGDNA